MKILFPIGSFFPAQSGGPNNTLFWHTSALNKFFEVYIVTTCKDIEEEEVLFNKWISKDFGSIIYLKSYFSLNRIKLILKSIFLIRNFDIVHLTSIFYPPSLVIALFAVLFNKRIVWSVRGELDPEALIYSNFKKNIFIKIISLIQKNINFHSTCDAESNYIMKNFESCSSIVQLPNYLTLEKRLLSNQNKYLLFIGRLHPKKAIDNLITSLSKSKIFLSSNFVLKIAGEKNQYSLSLQEKVSELNLNDKIFFLGLVKGLEKSKLYANAYFTIMPSHTENFGNVIVESLNQGTPCVASKGTPWSILEKNKVGFWVNNDVESLTQIINKIMTLNNVEYEKMRENSYRFVSNHFDVNKNIHHWIKKYKAI